MSDKIKALLATGRVSNLPTVWCNCLAATLIILQFSSSFSPWLNSQMSEHGLDAIKDFVSLELFFIIVSSLFYVGGCFLGDHYDQEFDTEHKPDRPIPSGVLSSKLVFGLGLFQMGLGFILTVTIPSLLFGDHSTSIVIYPTLLLVLVINLYSRYHKKSLFIGLPLIGLCRFFLIIFAASVASTIYINGSHNTLTDFNLTPDIFFASAVCIYTIAFASVARTESSKSPITWRNTLRYTMLALPLIVLLTNQNFEILTALAILIYAAWLIYSFQFIDSNKGKFVSQCLAGFCLLDACFVAQFGWQWLITCLILFLVSLQLQKIAPAT